MTYESYSDAVDRTSKKKQELGSDENSFPPVAHILWGDSFSLAEARNAFALKVPYMHPEGQSHVTQIWLELFMRIREAPTPHEHHVYCCTLNQRSHQRQTHRTKKMASQPPLGQVPHPTTIKLR